MLPRTFLAIVALMMGLVVLPAACKNPGPSVVAQPDPLPPLGVIVPITAADGAHSAAPEGVPQAFVDKCGICHTVADAGTEGVIGPELTNIGDIAGTRTDLSAEDYIRQSIEEPGAFLSPGYAALMPAGLKDTLGGDYEAVVAYLMTLQEAQAEPDAAQAETAPEAAQ